MLANLVFLLTDQPCVQCGISSGPLCPTCSQKQLVARSTSCFACSRANSTGRTCGRCSCRHALDGVAIAYRLDGAIQRLIHELKYEHNRAVASWLAAHLVEQFANTTQEFDVLSFVPSDGASQRVRGFNQAKLIARAVGRKAGLPAQELLLRVRHTAQVGHGRMERIALVRNNFILNGRDVAGQRVLLVDDVITTGATLDECARMLKNAGATEVWGLVVAKK